MFESSVLCGVAVGLTWRDANPVSHQESGGQVTWPNCWPGDCAPRSDCGNRSPTACKSACLQPLPRGELTTTVGVPYSRRLESPASQVANPPANGHLKTPTTGPLATSGAITPIASFHQSDQLLYDQARQSQACIGPLSP
jgi:hypothetical protein